MYWSKETNKNKMLFKCLMGVIKIAKLAEHSSAYVRPDSLSFGTRAQAWLDPDGQASSDKSRRYFVPVKRTKNHPTAFVVEINKVRDIDWRVQHNSSLKGHCIPLHWRADRGRKTLTQIATLEDALAHEGVFLAGTGAISLPPKYILGALDDMFLPKTVLNEVLIHTSIPQVIAGEMPIHPGVILYGPPGTGKTELLRSLVELYERAGCHTHELTFSGTFDIWVSSFGKKLDQQLQIALDTANGRPVLVYADESSSLVMSSGGDITSHYYEEGLGVLKSYVGNVPELVVAVTTNLDPTTFDSAVVREGRLNPIKIDLPTQRERADMWQCFLTRYKIGDGLGPIHATLLAKRFPQVTGAAIEKLCESYATNGGLIRFANRGGSILDALRNDKELDFDPSTVPYRQLVKDLERELAKRPYKEAMGLHGRTGPARIYHSRS
ncbi:hypothetical protein COV18_04725 [Candidatus Woesearchaeota archaeon CG10_big_fil_rev_8_21_14_0_10_37_12]|nr:MAG: hypothetical protein COV18_04725 [Candidatus Woesearchaeota archaeon CG10_big_fil_rev_8_21_14_0_10_37_12]